jgi:hypothetical protein
VITFRGFNCITKVISNSHGEREREREREREMLTLITKKLTKNETEI